jgi:hypothetical protein
MKKFLVRNEKEELGLPYEAKLINILSYDDAEALTALLEPKKSKLRGLPTSFFRRKLLLSARHGKRVVPAISVRPLTANSQKILVGLLWEALFGKKFKVLHWNILFDCLTRTIQNDRSSEALMRILRILSTAQAGQDYRTTMRSVKKIVSKKLGAEQAEEYIQQKILNLLPFKLPHKNPHLEEVLEVDWSSKMVQKKPLEQRRVGVGYKDKGSLRQDSVEEPLAYEFQSRADFFELLISKTQDCEQFS